MKNNRKRALIIEIGDLLDSHPKIEYKKYAKCQCTVCKEIKRKRILLEKEMKSKIRREISITKNHKYKVFVEKDGKTKEFKSVNEASLFLGLRKYTLTQRFFYKETDVLLFDGYEVRREVVSNIEKKESDPK